MKSSRLARQVGIEVVHELGELQGVVNTQKKVVVIGEKHEGVKSDGIEPQGTAQDTESHGPQLHGRFQKKPTLYCPTSHFDERAAFRNEA